MATLASGALRWLAAQWESAITSAVCSGIVGDARHAAEGGYHISREDQPASSLTLLPSTGSFIAGTQLVVRATF